MVGYAERDGDQLKQALWHCVNFNPNILPTTRTLQPNTECGEKAACKNCFGWTMFKWETAGNATYFTIMYLVATCPLSPAYHLH